MAPVLSLAPVTVVAISHPVIALTLLMAKKKINEKEMADFPFTMMFPRGPWKPMEEGCHRRRAKCGDCASFYPFSIPNISQRFWVEQRMRPSPVQQSKNAPLVRDFPRVLHLGFLTMVWYRVRISQACLATMLLTWDASRKNKTKGGQGKTLILVWNNWLLSPSIHCTFYKSLVTLHFDRPLPGWTLTLQLHVMLGLVE